MRAVIFSMILTVSLLLSSACKESEPIRIGFLGDLTTRSAGLSTSGRNGFQLAIEEINARGGINNRKIEGLIQDTHTKEDGGIHAVRNLINSNVSAIIGPMTSQTAVSTVPEINRAKVPMISPTVSTNQLNSLDDYFFRVYYTNAQAAKLLADKLSPQDAISQISVIYDISNSAYTEDWIRHFQQALEQDGGSLLAKIPFDSRADPLLLDLATQAAVVNPQGILILANAVDTAMICQQLTKIGVNLPRYATGWSYSDDLIQFGGKSVEGLYVIQSANLQDSSSEMQHFIEAYKNRFHSFPNFPALHAYDATHMILTVLEKTTNAQTIRKELLNLSNFKGIQSDLSLDRFGDLKHPRLHLAQVINGRFVITN